MVCREGERQLGGQRDSGAQLNTHDWSLPVKGATVSAAALTAATAATATSSSQSSSLQRSRCPLPVPVPVYCEPLTTTDSTMKVEPLSRQLTDSFHFTSAVVAVDCDCFLE